ncbi:hypothetical protein KCP71_02095 [Salmonella enterica subsp. enterica]|nr:hypothetical protein KCP71_02095 [Salmonella enterica subsp. enterica]
MRSESNYPAVTVCSSSDKRIAGIKVGLPPFFYNSASSRHKEETKMPASCELRSSSVASKL